MSFSKNKYLVIRGIVSKELANFVYRYFLNKRLVAKTMLESKVIDSTASYFGSWSDSQVPQTYSHYSDIVMETLLLQLKPSVEELTGLKLIETYSYARIYKKGDVLHRHKDRLSCEISTTLNLGGPVWPIFIEPNSNIGVVENGNYIPGNTNGIEINLTPGDMIIYRGCELEHWRDAFDSDDCAQVFLHYNDAESSHAQINRFDTRPHIGLPASFKKS